MLCVSAQSHKKVEGSSDMQRLLRYGLGILCGLLLVATGPRSYAQGAPTGTPHSVTLSWIAPSPIGGSGAIAGYNLYRSPSGPPAFTKLNATPIVGLSAVDTTAAGGTAYTYCATTLDSAGSESACSIQVTVAVPSNPDAPTGLVGSAK